MQMSQLSFVSRSYQSPLVVLNPMVQRLLTYDSVQTLPFPIIISPHKSSRHPIVISFGLCSLHRQNN